MARKRYSDDDVLKLLREVDVHLHVVSSFHRDRLSQIPWLVNIRPHRHRSVIGQ